MTIGVHCKLKQKGCFNPFRVSTFVAATTVRTSQYSKVAYEARDPSLFIMLSNISAHSYILHEQ